jgi:hypothetical protein
MTDELKIKTLNFLENCEKFYGKTIEIKSALSSNQVNFDRHFTSFAYTEFVLQMIYTRISGGRVNFAGEKLYYEICLDHLISFEEINANEFQWLEKYSEKVYRKTNLKIIEK